MTQLTGEIARHFREIHFGKNWTWVNLKDSLEDVTWQEAVTQVYSCNTIAALLYHINYYVNAALNVLKGGPLTSSDQYSFNHPPVQSQDDWQTMQDKAWREAEEFAELVAQMPEEKLFEIFNDEKYGSYYRNIHGIIEHAHYHLGQIVLLKKIIRQKDQSSHNANDLTTGGTAKQVG